MSQKLSLVGRHVYVDRTIAFAALAGEAEIEGFFYVLVAPAIANYVAVQHLPKVMSAPARGVPFFVRDHEAGTHGVVVRFSSVFAPAFANANAAQRGMGKAAVIFGPLEMGFGFPRPVCSPQAQVLVHTVGVDNLARIHLPLRVPNRFELAECIDEFRAEHLMEELASRLSVAVLAAQTAAVPYAKVGSLFHEGAPLLDTSFGFNVEIDTAMHATLSEVAV